MALTNMNSDLRFNPSSELCINLFILIIYTSTTAPQDAHKWLMLQVYLC